MTGEKPSWPAVFDHHSQTPSREFVPTRGDAAVLYKFWHKAAISRCCAGTSTAKPTTTSPRSERPNLSSPDFPRRSPSPRPPRPWRSSGGSGRKSPSAWPPSRPCPIRWTPLTVTSTRRTAIPARSSRG